MFTSLTARARVSQLRDPAAIGAWLATICFHRSFSVKRRGRRLQELQGAVTFPRVTPPATGSLELHELVEQLPPRDRAVVVLQHGYARGARHRIRDEHSIGAVVGDGRGRALADPVCRAGAGRRL